MMYYSPRAIVQGNGKRSRAFAIERLVRQGCSGLLALEPLLRKLRDEETSPALRSIHFADPLSAKVSAYVDNITVFMPHRLAIKAVKKAVARYEQRAGAKVNFDKSEGLRLGSWRGSVPLPGPFCWSDGSDRILDVWFGSGLQLDRNWSEVQTQVDVPGFEGNCH